MNTTYISTVKILDWILKHPKRELAFGKGNDLAIAMLFDSGLRIHVAVDRDENPLAVIFFNVDSEKENLDIKHILAENCAGFHALVEAWEECYPNFTVSGIRYRSKKFVKHQIKDFKNEHVGA